MENDTKKSEYLRGGPFGYCLGTPTPAGPGTAVISESGPEDTESKIDLLSFELEDPTVHRSYDFTHFKEFLYVGDCERTRSYYFSPSDDEKPLVIRVDSVEWLRVGKNGHVLVMADGTVLFIPYGWVAMSYEPAIPGNVRYTK